MADDPTTESLRLAANRLEELKRDQERFEEYREAITKALFGSSVISAPERDIVSEINRLKNLHNSIVDLAKLRDAIYGNGPQPVSISLEEACGAIEHMRKALESVRAGINSTLVQEMTTWLVKNIPRIAKRLRGTDDRADVTFSFNPENEEYTVSIEEKIFLCSEMGGGV